MESLLCCLCIFGVVLFALPSFSLNWSWVLLGTLATVVVYVAVIFVLRSVLIQLPATYFMESYSRDFWMSAHPIIRWAGLIFKNLVGAALVALGIVLSMPAVPGPGVLIILLGTIMLDFPGKRRLQIWLVRRPRILLAINRMRRQHGKTPLIFENQAAQNVSKA